MFSPVLQESLNSVMYPKDVTIKLVNLFFQTLNLQRHPVPKDIIDEAIEGLYKDNTLVTEQTLSKFSLLASVLAISSVFLFVGNPELSFEIHNVSNTFTYSKVLELHHAFVKFVSDLPFYFQIKLVNNQSVVDSRCDSYFPFLKLQRLSKWIYPISNPILMNF
ncbi:hypothetical protein MCAP1_002924 [Malassezia caprae]|uniref:Uncharacterized protein n=1 Tax=Malassezia caprae TaxID=1381934 RepID=A0AAF0EAI1_9BASI|nr:hypothetical protein MCAP1_002924 [Malassezia caprae]